MINFLKTNSLWITLKELKGNPKWSILTEPLWFIPYSLFQPFQTLFMRELGVSNIEIGFTLSVGYFLQMIFAILGGVITDKMGRRKATVIFDSISWTIPCLIWAFSQNFWWFLTASVVNASFQITNTSWSCLFIEDCPPKHITNAFTLIQMCGMLSVFASPIAIYLVGKNGVVPVIRGIYLVSAVSMSLKFYFLYRYGGETQMGKQRLQETKGVSFWSMLLGYRNVLVKIIKSKRMMFVVFFMAISNISLIATNNFFSIYITNDLRLQKGLVAVFPMVRTVIMWIFLLGLHNLFAKLKMKQSIVVGLLVYAASHVVLICAPQGNLGMIVVYTVLEASAYAIIIPRKDALMALFVEKGERSRIFALYNALMIAISTPFGSIVGWLAEMDGMYPFLFNIGLFVLAIIVVCLSKDLFHDKFINGDKV